MSAAGIERVSYQKIQMDISIVLWRQSNYIERQINSFAHKKIVFTKYVLNKLSILSVLISLQLKQCNQITRMQYTHYDCVISRCKKKRTQGNEINYDLTCPGANHQRYS